MAQQGPDSQNVNAQSNDKLDNENPQLLNSEMAKAFQELAHGERTASALETKLDGIESRIEQLLASMENNTRQPDSSKPEAQSQK